MVIRSQVHLSLLILNGVRALLLVLIGGTVWWALQEPDPPSVSPIVPTGSFALQTSSLTQHDLTWYAPLWTRNLKQSPIPPPAPPPPDPRPTVLPTLLATCVDDATRFAHVKDRTGRRHMTQVDQSVDGYRISQIEIGRIQFDDGRTTHWVELPSKDR